MEIRMVYSNRITKVRNVFALCVWVALVPSLIQAQENSNRVRISLPGKIWALVLNLRGFSLKTNETKPDGRRYFFAANEHTGVVVSVFLEEVDPATRPKSCRENLKARAKAPGPFRIKDVRFGEWKQFATLEYFVPEFRGVKFQQENLFACLLHESVFIDFHLSKVSFAAGEEKLFLDVLETQEFQEGVNRTSREYLEFGSTFYITRDYKGAIGPYQKALDLEKIERKLDETSWRVLVDNLGMSYGLTGDLKSAQEVFEYGISKDPTYPLFYYNMACVFAERNDLDNATTYLKKAFEYKQNGIPGEKMPDPRKDDSFQRFMKNDSFRKLADSLAGSMN